MQKKKKLSKSVNLKVPKKN